MARGDGLYSRVIAWLKILLPLAALALLSTLFLLSRSTEQVLDVPFAEALRGEGVAREHVSAPYYAGTTESGDSLTMTAKSAAPEGEGLIRAEDLAATLRKSDGSEILLNAVHATLSDHDQTALMEGGVRIESSSGYVLNTETLTSAIDRIEAESGGPVQGEGPLGTIEAGKMRIDSIGEDGGVQLLFTEGVKLIYTPKD